MVTVSVLKCHFCSFISCISSFKFLNIFLIAVLEFLFANCIIWNFSVGFCWLLFFKFMGTFSCYFLCFRNFDYIVDIMNDAFLKLWISFIFFERVRFVLGAVNFGWIHTPKSGSSVLVCSWNFHSAFSWCLYVGVEVRGEQNFVVMLWDCIIYWWAKLGGWFCMQTWRLMVSLEPLFLPKFLNILSTWILYLPSQASKCAVLCHFYAKKLQICKSHSLFVF